MRPFKNLLRGVVYDICELLWQKEAVQQKISFLHCSLQLINNNFCPKCWLNYYSLFYVQEFQRYDFYNVTLLGRTISRKTHANLIDANFFSSVYVFILEFKGITKTKCISEAMTYTHVDA